MHPLLKEVIKEAMKLLFLVFVSFGHHTATSGSLLSFRNQSRGLLVLLFESFKVKQTVVPFRFLYVTEN